MAAAEPAGVPVIVNDRIDVALAAGAHGVHVGQDDLPCTAVRQIVGSGMIVGVSVKTAEQAAQAALDGADYVGAGAVFDTTTKDSRAIGVDGLCDIVRVCPVPVLGIGGIQEGNVGEVMAAGAAGIAVVSAVFAANDVEEACRVLRHAVAVTEVPILTMPSRVGQLLTCRLPPASPSSQPLEGDGWDDGGAGVRG
jgi:thiamine-phosphate diphosphorylase